MKVYNYLFFKISQIVGLFIESSVFASIIVFCWIFMFNSFTLLYMFSDYPIVLSVLDLYASIYGGIVVVGGHLLYFFWNQRYVKIYEEFKNEEKKSSIYGYIVVVSYVILSVYIFFSYSAPNMGGILK